MSKMLQGEMEKLLHMEENVGKRVVGQEEAVEAVANAVRRSRAGLGDERRPIGSCSSGRRGSARQSWRGRSPSFCSTTSER